MDPITPRWWGPPPTAIHNDPDGNRIVVVLLSEAPPPEHIASPECWCQPFRQPGAPNVWIHHKFDG